MPWAALIHQYKIPIFYISALAAISTLVAGLLIDVPLLALSAFLVVGFFVVLFDYKLLFYLLLLVLPLSDELVLTNSFSLHFPTEPLMITLLLLSIPYLIINHKKMSGKFWSHPITLIVFCNLLWVLITTVSATYPVVSIKYFIAKLWFIGVFYFLGAHLVQTYTSFKRVVFLLIVPTVIAIVYVLIRHGLEGFLFDRANAVVRPFYRNHVNYGVWMAAILPLVLLARSWFQKNTLMRLLFSIIVLLNLAAVYFSYTRGAWLAVLVLPVFIVVLNWKLVKPALLVAATGILIFLGTLLHQNTYLKYAPEFSKTIYHEEFSDHMAATFQMQDMSTVERFYRWIAAVKMFEARPILGFGPGNFVNNYKQYTISAYETYMSDNDERSSVHNYFLTMLTEQGIPGLVIFIIMIVLVLVYFEKVYHQQKDNQQKMLVLALACCFAVLLVNNVFSDLLEADKLGPLFFLCMAILVNLDLKGITSTKTSLLAN